MFLKGFIATDPLLSSSGMPFGTRDSAHKSLSELWLPDRCQNFDIVPSVVVDATKTDFLLILAGNEVIIGFVCHGALH
jgi:hypothetical protein